MAEATADERHQPPLHVFRFQVDIQVEPITDSSEESARKFICGGAFSECTGLEATMEPKVINEGGRNYGPAQRAGQVTFGTVILKRGMTMNRNIYEWFKLLTSDGQYAERPAVLIHMKDHAGDTKLTWSLANALPIKFKAADLNAKGTDVGVEELHLAHEGLSLESQPPSQAASSPENR